jgi:hypothetical protein
MKVKTVFIITIVTSLLLAGCGKHNSTPKKTNCHINNISVEGTSYVINYNADGKIKTMANSDNYIWNYTYTGNTIMIIETQGGTFLCKFTIQLNNSGLPISYFAEPDQSGTNWTKYDYEYNGSALSKETITDVSGIIKIVNFTFDGNNIVLGDNGFAFDYYTDKRQQPGDYLEYSQLLGSGDGFVFNCFLNKNLMKSFRDQTGETASFTYDFDSDGKITSMTIFYGSSPKQVVYQYECK